MFWPQNCCMALISSPLIAITGFSSTCCSKHNVPGKDEKGGDRDRREGQTVQWMGKNSQCQVYTDMGSCKNMPLLITHCRQLLTIWGFNLHPVLFNGEGDSYMLKSNTWNVSTKLKVNHTGLCVCGQTTYLFYDFPRIHPASCLWKNTKNTMKSEVHYTEQDIHNNGSINHL